MGTDMDSGKNKPDIFPLTHSKQGRLLWAVRTTKNPHARSESTDLSVTYY
jgi:hypothetical protein